MAKEEQSSLPGVSSKSKTWALGESHGYLSALQRRCSVPSQAVAFWSAEQLQEFREGYESGYSRARSAMVQP